MKFQYSSIHPLSNKRLTDKGNERKDKEAYIRIIFTEKGN